MPKKLNDDSPLAELLLQYMSVQIEQVKIKFSELLGLTAGKELNSESYSDLLHDLRVASRRIVSVVSASSDFMPVQLSPGVVAPFKDLLKITARLRDLDVFCSNLNAVLASQLSDSSYVNINQLIAYVEKKRLKAWYKLAEKVNDSTPLQKARLNYKSVINSEKLLNRALKKLRRNENLACCRIKDASAAVLFKSSAEITSFESSINEYRDKDDHLNEEPQKSQLSSRDLHKLRLAFKEFRYTVEMFNLVYPSKSDSLQETVKNMQDALGSWHDMEFALAETKKWVRKYKYGYDISERFELLAASERKIIMHVWKNSKASYLQSMIGEWMQFNWQMH